VAKKRKLSSFERSFVAARRSGAKEFSFGGKKYSTKQKGEGGGTVKAAAAKVPTPTPRPDRQAQALPTKNAPTPSPRPGTAEPPKASVPTRPKAKPSSDSMWKARDEEYKRKTAELATTKPSGPARSTPSPNKLVSPPIPSTKPTFGLGSKDRPALGTTTASKLPQGKVVDYSVRRGTPGKITDIGGTKFETISPRPTAAASGKTARLPKNEARTTPKTGRLKKTTVVARR
jgi:hypothetical protein